MRATVMVNQLWASIADAGRDLLRGRGGRSRRPGLERLCSDLLSTRGEASGAALAREVVEAYRSLPDTDRLAFFQALARDHAVSPAEVRTRSLPGALLFFIACSAFKRRFSNTCCISSRLTRTGGRFCP